jgi:hypothetical protein
VNQAPSNIRPGVVSAMIYLPIALLAAGAFLTATAFTGDYTWVARLGGSGWVFFLSIIVLMPTVIPLVKRRIRAA